MPQTLEDTTDNSRNTTKITAHAVTQGPHLASAEGCLLGLGWGHDPQPSTIPLTNRDKDVMLNVQILAQ